MLKSNTLHHGQFSENSAWREARRLRDTRFLQTPLGKAYILSIILYMVEGLIPQSMFEYQREFRAAEALFLLCFIGHCFVLRLESGSSETATSSTSQKFGQRGGPY